MIRSAFLRLAALTGLLALLGCGGGANGPCSGGFQVRFEITEVREGLPLDSLEVSIAIGGGAPQRVQANLKTGRSSAAVRAQQGQPYALTFALFSTGRRIGGGESQGRLACDLGVELDPVWNDGAIDDAKKALERGTLLPPDLTGFFGFAVAGKPYELPLEPPDSVSYRWYVKLGDSNVVEGEGRRVAFTMPAELAGKEVVIRLHAVSARDGRILEERKWPIRVLAAPSRDRLARALIRADSASTFGSSLAFFHEGGRLVRIEGYDALEPAAGAAPAWAESLSYSEGRLSRAAVRLPDGSRLDTLFAYNAEGRLAAVEARSARDTVVDSLFFANGRLSYSRRYVSGKVRESAVFSWSGTESREDSVFTLGASGLELSRIVRNRFRADSLVERTVLVGRTAPVALQREVIAYNGLGLRAYREVYAEGHTPRLEITDRHSYDAEGRPLTFSSKDEVTGDSRVHIRYVHAASPAAKAAAAALPDPRAGRGALEAVRFAHDLSDLLRRSAGVLNPGDLP